VHLEPEAEEVATFYAGVLNTEHVENSTFNENFFRDFKTVLAKSDKVIFCMINKVIIL
jgi:DNA topoisomerase-1